MRDCVIRWTVLDPSEGEGRWFLRGETENGEGTGVPLDVYWPYSVDSSIARWLDWDRVLPEDFAAAMLAAAADVIGDIEWDAERAANNEIT